MLSSQKGGKIVIQSRAAQINDWIKATLFIALLDPGGSSKAMLDHPSIQPSGAAGAAAGAAAADAAGAAAGAAAADATILATTCVAAKVRAVAAAAAAPAAAPAAAAAAAPAAAPAGAPAAAPATPGNSHSMLPRCMGPGPLVQGTPYGKLDGWSFGRKEDRRMMRFCFQCQGKVACIVQSWT